MDVYNPADELDSFRVFGEGSKKSKKTHPVAEQLSKVKKSVKELEDDEDGYRPLGRISSRNERRNRDYSYMTYNRDFFITWSVHCRKWEGGLANDPDDHGGLTNMGITIATWKDLAPKLCNARGTEEELKKLENWQWDKIARNAYWEALMCDKITSEGIACTLCDFGWGSGFYYAVYTLQVMLNKKFRGQLELDGIIGKRTLRWLNESIIEFGEKEVLTAFTEARANFIKRCVKQGGIHPKYEVGLLNRVYDLANKFFKNSKNTQTT